MSDDAEAAAWAVYTREQREQAIAQCRQSRLLLHNVALETLATFRTACPGGSANVTHASLRARLCALVRATQTYAARRVPPFVPEPAPSPAAKENGASQVEGAFPRRAPKPVVFRAPEGVKSIPASAGGDDGTHAFVRAFDALVADVLAAPGDAPGTRRAADPPDLRTAEEERWFVDDVLRPHLRRAEASWGRLAQLQAQTVFLEAHPEYRFDEQDDPLAARERYYDQVLRPALRPAAGGAPLDPTFLAECLAWSGPHAAALSRTAPAGEVVDPPFSPAGAHALLEAVAFARHLPPDMALPEGRDENPHRVGELGYRLSEGDLAAALGEDTDVPTDLPWVVHLPLQDPRAAERRWRGGLDHTGSHVDLRYRIEVLLAEDLAAASEVKRGTPTPALVVLPAAADLVAPAHRDHALPDGAFYTHGQKVRTRWAAAPLAPALDERVTAPHRTILGALFPRTRAHPWVERYAQVDLVQALYTTQYSRLLLKRELVDTRVWGPLGAPAAARADDAALSLRVRDEVVALAQQADAITTMFRLVTCAAQTIWGDNDAVRVFRRLAADWQLRAQDLLPAPVHAALRQLEEVLAYGGYGPIEATLDHGGASLAPPILPRDLVRLEAVRLCAQAELRRLLLEHYLADWMGRDDPASVRAAFRRVLSDNVAAVDLARAATLFQTHVASSAVAVLGHTTVGAGRAAGVLRLAGLRYTAGGAAAWALHVALHRGVPSAALDAFFEQAPLAARPEDGGVAPLPGNTGALVSILHALALRGPAYTPPEGDARLGLLVARLRAILETYRLEPAELDLARPLPPERVRRVRRELLELVEPGDEVPASRVSHRVVGGLVVDDPVAGQTLPEVLVHDLPLLVPPDLYHNAVMLKHALRQDPEFWRQSPPSSVAQ